VFLLILFFASVWGSLAADNVSAPRLDPRISIHEGFVAEKTCATCHGDQAAAFAKSHHVKRQTTAPSAVISTMPALKRHSRDSEGSSATRTRRGSSEAVRSPE
jgi:hypothetical protein